MPGRSLPVLTALCLLATNATAIDYPQIEELEPSDPLFQQHQEDMRLFFTRSRSGRDLPALALYSYTAAPDESLLTISARLNVPYSSLATLNGFTTTDLDPDRPQILIPNLPGMFIPKSPRNHIDRLLRDLRSQELTAAIPVRISTADGVTEFYFLPGEDFRPDERRSFLGAMFVMPVDSTRITSYFGYRRHPITDLVQFHRGVDFAAPYAARVRVAADGVVTRIGFDRLLGNFVVVEHKGDYETYYAHLSKTHVTLNETVGLGTIIGRVGTSGLTTGPHLHFEVREAGRPKDPLLLLPPFRSRTTNQ